MTKKQELILGLELVKNEHTKWANYAEAKFKGLEVNEELTPVKHTECACGKMFSENGQIRFHLQSAQSIPVDHEEFHKIYEILYNLINKEEKGNIFTKGTLKKKKEKQINDYLGILKNLSENIKFSFDNVYKEVEDIPEEQFKKIFGG